MPERKRPARRNGGSRGGSARDGAARNGGVLHRPRLSSSAAVLTRFGRLFGKRFTRNNLDLLTPVHAAVMALRRSERTIRGRGVNIFTQWIGDPDALGSAVLLSAILSDLGAKEVRILTGTLGHPQNRFLVDRCGIRLHDPNEQRLPRGLNCTVDTSPPLGMSNTGPVQPVRDFFFVADHHADPEEVEENCRAQGVRSVRHAFVGLPVGSTSSFLAALGFAFGITEALGPEGRAAAALGIYTDTSALLHGATALDFRMFEKLTRDEATVDVLDELRDYRVPPEWLTYRSQAFLNAEVTGNVRVAPIGYVKEDYRDVIAEVASDLLRIEGTSIGISVAVTEMGTEVSVRADSRLLRTHGERIVRVIEHLLEYAFPGVSGFKYDRRPPYRVEGGASVPHEAAQERAWKLGTAESNGAERRRAMLDHCRAIARGIIAALEDLKFARPEEIQGLL
jgi:nanoRNase/pAp phosphatase (c-di-AMP/oligoRNAs hydrolase)